MSQGKVNIDIASFPAGTTRESIFYYTTNSTYVNIQLCSNEKVSYTVSLYDKNGTMIGTLTDSVGNLLGRAFTFSHLTSTQTYFFRVTNNGSSTTQVTGYIDQLLY